MLHIVHRAQEGMDLRAPCDPVRPELPDEQQHLAPALPAVDECISYPVGESAAMVLWLCQWNRFSLME